MGLDNGYGLGIGSLKPGVCTSSTRPTSPFDGQVIYMTDVDQTAVWDGSQWTVLAPIAGGRNALINGDFKVWQRGTSFADSAFGLTTDRWEAGRGGFATGLTVSRQTGPTNFQYCARVQRASGNTSTQNIRFATTLETANSLSLAGKTVTLSFYARCGANYSTASNQLEAYVRSGTTTDAARIGAGDAFGTGAATPVSLTATLTTSWQRFTASGTVGSTATQLGLILYSSPTGTAGADDWYEVAGVQLEAGAVATPFEFEDAQVTLAKCQRYFCKTFSQGVTPATGVTGEGALWRPRHYTAATDTYLVTWHFPVEMRVAPTTVTTFRPFSAGSSGWYDEAGGTMTAATGSIGTRGMYITNTSTSATGRFALIHATASAEL
jgi:hypothetical protein